MANIVCSGSSDPFYIVSYTIKWVTTVWTYTVYNIYTQCQHITGARFGTRLGMDPKLEDMMWTSLTDFYTKVSAILLSLSLSI